MRLERHPAVPPEMKTERANPAENRHYRGHQKPDRDRHAVRRLRRRRAETNGASERLSGLSGQQNCQGEK